MAKQNEFTFESKIGEITDDLFGTIEQRISRATLHLHGKLINKLSGSRIGFLYPVPATGRVVNAQKTLPNGRVFHYRKLEGARYYRASAPNEAPASRLGDLRTSYQFKIKGSGANTKGYVGSPLKYAVYLERGTQDIHKRPHLRKTAEEEHDAIVGFFTDLVEQP